MKLIDMERTTPHRHALRHPSSRRISNRAYAGAVALALAAQIIGACGPLFSDLPEENTVFDGPIAGLSSTQLSIFIAGDEAFGQFFDAETGLGPLFNQPSCTSCHPNDGRGHPSTRLIRFGRGDALDASGFDYLPGLGGPQLQDHALPGFSPEQLPDNVARSVRTGPIVAGLGLIEAIDARTILAAEDPQDLDGDGIRGVANFIETPAFMEAPEKCACDGCRLIDGTCRQLGRFGRKSTAINLLHQTVVAYLHDMGITSDALPVENFGTVANDALADAAADPEVSADVVRQVVFYLRTLKPPTRRNAGDPEVKRGEQIFSSIGCATCHRPTMRTGQNTGLDALNERDVPLYSDLLLHDMGEQLADRYPEQMASGFQWRTTPLWGIGIVEGQLGGQPYYLHDGRAKTLTDAIVLHGGEGQGSTDAFEALTAAEKDALLAFLGSL